MAGDRYRPASPSPARGLRAVGVGLDASGVPAATITQRAHAYLTLPCDASGRSYPVGLYYRSSRKMRMTTVVLSACGIRPCCRRRFAQLRGERAFSWKHTRDAATAATTPCACGVMVLSTTRAFWTRNTRVMWLIPSEIIYLSQRLSHASRINVKLRKAH